MRKLSWPARTLKSNNFVFHVPSGEPLNAMMIMRRTPLPPDHEDANDQDLYREQFNEWVDGGFLTAIGLPTKSARRLYRFRCNTGQVWAVLPAERGPIWPIVNPINHWALRVN